ncbi:MAG: family 10 glycosylhydrolase [Pirellulales bacterium]|nr:family 10 glycosylhydrolase [Pirellulales bacterium]
MNHLRRTCSIVVTISFSFLAIAMDAAHGADQLPSAPGKPNVPRNEAFFGVHFDLHPNAADTALGRDVTEEAVRDFLRRARPDFVQYDCVGVPGYTGYATKVGWPAPGIVKDSLAVWRKVTREEGVALLIHYCVLWNAAAVAHHPDWAAVNAQGQGEKEILSVFSPFAERLLIPHLKEAATRYDLDGAWMDADAWIARLDYSPAALAEWKRQTGREAAPKSRRDPHWQEWKMFQRREFEKYLSRYVDALHAHSPKFQIGCNWMYSLLSGVWPVGSRVDYLTGDYSQHDSTDEARAEARYFSGNGKPWDLLAWGFNRSGLKDATQLKQEAAATITQGGGWGIYYVPTRSGQISPEITALAGEAADFCRARQKLCFRSTPVPQVALLQSAETYWDRADATAFHQADCALETKGALHALLELHYSVDVRTEHQLLPQLGEYPVVVVAEAYKLADAFRKSLLDYVEAGGALVLVGGDCARLFEPMLGVQWEEKAQKSGFLVTGGQSVALGGDWWKITPTTAKTIGYRYATADAKSGREPAATIVARGKGRIAAIYGPVSAAYRQNHHPATSQLLAAVMREAFPEPAVQIDGLGSVDVALRRTCDGRLSVHILNLSKIQRGDQFLKLAPLPAVGPFTVRLRMAGKPAAVRWEPDGGQIDWTWEDPVLRAAVPGLEIHGALVVE